MTTIIPIPALKDNYIWLLTDEDNQNCLIVDPGESKPLLDYLRHQSITPISILITHHHWDHVGGIDEITQHYDIPVYTPASETVTGSTNPVKEGDTLPFPEVNLILNVLDVPGHTSGAVAYYNSDIVFSGDTLFTAGCGRMFEGTPPQMHSSLEKFKSLDKNTLLYCGHEYTEANLKFAHAVEPENLAIQTRQKQIKQLREQNQPTVPATLSIELDTNPFLRCREKSVVLAASEYAQKSLSEPHEVFAALRQWKDNF